MATITLSGDTLVLGAATITLGPSSAGPVIPSGAFSVAGSRKVLFDGTGQRYTSGGVWRVK